MARGNNTTTNNRNNYFRAGRGGRGRWNNRNNSQGRGGRGWNNQRNNSRKNRKDDKFQESENVVIKYDKAKITDDEFKWKFLIYEDTSETTMTLQTYEGNSYEELLSAIIKFWCIIEEYEMLPTNQANPEQAPPLTRNVLDGMVGLVYPPLPVGRERDAEIRRREAHVSSTRIMVFRTAKNILKTTAAKTAYAETRREIYE